MSTFTVSSGSQNFISPINLLLANPTVRAYLRNFRYLRCGFNLRVETVTTPMQFGAVGVSWLPYTNEFRDISLTAQSQSSMHILDMCQQQSLEVSLPYLRPQLYYDLEDAIQQDWRLGFYGFVVDTITAGSPSTVVLNVFASMSDPEAAGYVPASGAFQSKMGHLGFASSAATLAASMYVMGGGTEFSLPVDNVEAPSENAKLSLLGDIASPQVRNSTTCTKLGDQVSGKRIRSSTSMDIYSLGEISQVPVHSSTFALSKTVPRSIELTPFPVMAHSSYVKDMFKYFRGGSKILLKFLGSPMMSARVVINLYTTGLIKDPSDSIGDVMSWVLSIKGSQDWCVEVPYLQQRSWLSTDMQDYVPPVLTVSLLEDLPQPYDKTVSLYCLVFQSAGSDLCFAGLESFVPRVEEGAFQSVVGSMSTSVKLGTSARHPYQGKNMNVSNIVGRFGSRDGNPENFFPFPLEITSWAQGYELDNFDYIAQLYAFYTGDTHVKMLFSAAPAGGTLNVVFGNSKTSTIGNKFKAGNSMVVSHQGVWPAVEFVYPYMCEDEFNSIRYPVGMYPQDYDWSATVSEYLISATKDFSLHYLMPVPEFFRTPRPAAPVQGAFQSGNRIVGARNYNFNIVSTAGSSPAALLMATETVFQTSAFTVSLDVNMTRVSGTDNSAAFVAVTGSNTAITYPPANGRTTYSSTYLSCPLSWVDQSNNGRYVSSSRICRSFYNMNIGISLYVNVAVENPASVWQFTGTVTVTPWKHSNFLLNAESILVAPAVRVYTDPLEPVDINSNVSNPIYTFVQGGNQIPVDITDSIELPVLIGNSSANPVPVSLDASVQLNARVQGVVDPDTPIWTTNYR